MGTLPGRGEHLIHHFVVPLPLFAAQALQGKACESPLRHGAKASLRIVGAAVCLVLLPLYTSSRLCKTRLWSTKKRDVILFASLSNYISLSVLHFRLPIKKQTKSNSFGENCKSLNTAFAFHEALGGHFFS